MAMKREPECWTPALLQLVWTRLLIEASRSAALAVIHCFARVLLGTSCVKASAASRHCYGGVARGMLGFHTTVSGECRSRSSHHHHGRHKGRHQQQTDALNHAISFPYYTHPTPMKPKLR